METLNETTTMMYAVRSLLHEQEKPYTIISEAVAALNGSRNTNVEFQSGDVEVIQDVRGKEDIFSLDKQGFQFHRCEFKSYNWDDKEDIEMGYLEDVSGLLRDILGGNVQVSIFDWRVRKNKTYEESGIEQFDWNDPSNYLLPATAAHIDSTASSVKNRVLSAMGDHGLSLPQNRVRLVNVWKPIKHKVSDCPLAVCDGRGIRADDLLATDHITRDYVGELYNVIFRPGYKWYYMSRQSVDDVLLFKTYDSLPGDGAKYCPHAAFIHRDIPPGALPRESIEVRALVFG